VGASALIDAGRCAVSNPATASLYEVSRARPPIVVPLRTSVVICDRFSAGDFTGFGLSPKATLFARSGSVTSGFLNLSTAACTSLGCAQTCALR
jgi:hypothetical protein